MENKQPKTVPINVRPILKEFIDSRRAPLKKEFKISFIAVSEILMYYLSDSPKFTEDFAAYCKTNNEEDNLLKNLLG